jgi:1,4-alpha-glucan branching enzyme
MGWMNDTLGYMSKDPSWRKWHQDDLTFALVYAFSEKFTLVLSHDEVVHGKGSLMAKMPGDIWQKAASLRLLYTYMLTMPGKKMLFMGQDMGQFDEWSFDRALPWHLLDHEPHKGISRCVAQMNHFYKSHSELWHDDVTSSGFEWVSFEDRDHGVLIYIRQSPAGRLLCVHNFTPVYFAQYDFRAQGLKSLKEVFNSDAASFGGSGKQHALDIYVQEAEKFTIQLAPLATMIFEAHGS